MKILLLTFAFCLFTSLVEAAAPTVVQSIGATTFGAASVTTASITTSASGNLIVCDAAGYVDTGGWAATAITDNKGNTYTTVSGFPIASAGDSLAQGRVGYKENAAGGAGHTFTLNAAGPAYLAIACKEVSGALTSGALDKVATKVDNNGSTGNTSSLTASTAQADELLVGGGAIGEGLSTTISFTATGGFTTDQNFPNVSAGAFGLISASLGVTATGTYAFTYNLDAAPNGNMAWITTWKASGAAPAAVVRRPIIIQ